MIIKYDCLAKVSLNIVLSVSSHHSPAAAVGDALQYSTYSKPHITRYIFRSVKTRFYFCDFMGGLRGKPFLGPTQ